MKNNSETSADINSKLDDLEAVLSDFINGNNLEDWAGGAPDFIIAKYMRLSLENFARANREWGEWRPPPFEY